MKNKLKTTQLKNNKNQRGMVFYWVVGLVVILYVLSESILVQLRNEVMQANIIMRGEIMNTVCDSLVEEAFMEIRKQMNDHASYHSESSAYRVLRCGGADNKPKSIEVATPITLKLASDVHGIDPKNISLTVTYEQITPYSKDLMGSPRNIANDPYNKESYGVIKIVAQVGIDRYKRGLVACKDIKTVRVLPPFPEFSLFVRDGGAVMPKNPYAFNKWISYHGAEKLNLKVLNGQDATKTGVILFGGGYDWSAYNASGGAEFFEVMKGFSLMPSLQETNGKLPIVINVTNPGLLSKESGSLLDALKSKGDKQALGMWPSYDMLSRTEYNPNLMKMSKDEQDEYFMKSSLGGIMEPIIQRNYKDSIPGDLLPINKNLPAKNGKTPDPPKMIMRYHNVGAGSEIEADGEDPSPFSTNEPSRGYLNYFKDYIKFCNDTKREFLNPKGSGVDLFGADTRPNANDSPQLTKIYGKVLACHFRAMTIDDSEEAIIVPWVNFNNAQKSGQISCIPKTLKMEEKRKLDIKEKAGALLKITDPVAKELLEFQPQIGKATAASAKTYKNPIPDLSLTPVGDDNNIIYKHVMSKPIFMPYDLSVTGDSFFNETVPSYNMPVNELAQRFPLDLAPEMACYSFSNAKDFILNLQYMNKLIKDKDGTWHIFLDGIWFLEGMKAFEGEYQKLYLPPDAFYSEMKPSEDKRAKPSPPLYINGKGIIASIFGTDIFVDGIQKDKDVNCKDAQLSLVTPPNPLYEKIKNLPEEIKSVIFSSQGGDITVTDNYVQASICSGIGTLRYRDNPSIDATNFKNIVPYYGQDSKKNPPLNFDSFFIRGNVIVNYLNLGALEQEIGPNTYAGGGTIAYDDTLYPDRSGKIGDDNYVVNMSQSYTYYKLQPINKDEDILESSSNSTSSVPPKTE